MSVGEWIDRKVRMVKRICSWVFALVVLGVTAVGGLSLYGFVSPRIEVKEVERIVEREIPKPEKSDQEIAKELSEKYDVPWMLVWAVHLHETGNGRWLTRYEPGKYAAALKIDSFPEEAKALASSHGPMHVLGLTARSVYNTHWSKLYGEAGWETGVAYLSKGWHKFESLPIKERTDKALLFYNGGGDISYPTKVYAYLTPMTLEAMIRM